jgi:PhnB protein
MAVKPKPDGYHTVTPFMIVRGVPKFLDFLKQAFGAEEFERHMTPDGYVMHAEVRIGDSVIMMSEASERMGPVPSVIYLYVDDADAVYKKVLQAGAASIMEPANQFYGDRNAGVKDEFGNTWWIATHIEDVSPEEMNKRREEFTKKQK